jgi:hypothetical protein
MVTAKLIGRMFGHVTSSTCAARPVSFSTVGGVEIDSSVNVAAPVSPIFARVILYSGSAVAGAEEPGAAGDAGPWRRRASGFWRAPEIDPLLLVAHRLEIEPRCPRSTP